MCHCTLELIASLSGHTALHVCLFVHVFTVERKESWVWPWSSIWITSCWQDELKAVSQLEWQPQLQIIQHGVSYSLSILFTGKPLWPHFHTWSTSSPWIALMSSKQSVVCLILQVFFPQWCIFCNFKNILNSSCCLTVWYSQWALDRIKMEALVVISSRWYQSVYSYHIGAVNKCSVVATTEVTKQ